MSARASEQGSGSGSYRICQCRIHADGKTYPYLDNGLGLRPGDLVEVPVGATDDPVQATVLSVSDSKIPADRAVIRKVVRPVFTDPELYSELERAEEIKREKLETIVELNQKMTRLKYLIFALLAIFFSILGGLGLSLLTPAYYTTPTPSPTARYIRTTTPTPYYTPSVPYIGMYVADIPSRWEWGGTDNLRVRDSHGNSIHTTKYSYDARPYGEQKQYTIWVSNATSRVVDWNYTDYSATPKPRSTKKPKSTKNPALDYYHPEDFYEDLYDDFWDYVDAEDYWEEYG